MMSESGPNRGLTVIMIRKNLYNSCCKFKILIELILILFINHFSEAFLLDCKISTSIIMQTFMFSLTDSEFFSFSKQSHFKVTCCPKDICSSGHKPEAHL